MIKGIPVSGLLKPLLMWGTSQELALAWHRYEANDINLLADYPLGNYNALSKAVFIAAMDRTSLRLMLQKCGKAIEHGCKAFIFRTEHPTVLRWAERFGALKLQLDGHKARFYMDEETSPEWFALCLRSNYERVHSSPGCHFE